MTFNPRRYYKAETATNPARCSLCDAKPDIVVRLPIDLAFGWRRIISAAVDDAQPWVGLCEPCVAWLLDGFPEARASGARSDDTKSAGGSSEPGGER